MSSEVDQESESDYKLKTVQLGPKSRSIPVSWDIVRLEDISDVKRGASPRPIGDSKYFGGDIGWVRISDISNTGKYLTETEQYLSDEGVKESVRVYPGQVLLSISASVGKPVILGIDACIHDGLVGFRDVSDSIDCDYLYYALIDLRPRLLAKGQTGTQSNVNSTLVKRSKIPLPPLPEQSRIADILSTVDERIQQTDEMIEKTEELKQGLMQDLLIKGLSSGPTQEIQIGPRTLHISDHWDVEPCGQLFEATNGRAFKTEEWEEEGTQIIRIQDLRPGAEAETNYADFEVDEKYHVTDGDLLFCWAGNIKTSLGAYIWSGDDAYLNQHIYNLRPKKELDKRFFLFSLNQHLRLLKTMVGGSAGQVHITKGDFEGFKLPVPPVEEQERIADIIGCAQEKIEEEKAKKEDLQELKRGLMQDLLTGKVRVNTD